MAEKVVPFKTTSGKSDRFMLEVWVAEGLADIENTIYARPFLSRAGVDVFKDQIVLYEVKFTPSAALKALLLSEVKAAVELAAGK